MPKKKNKFKKAPRSGLPHGSISKTVVEAGVREILEAYKKFSDKPLNRLSVLDAGSGRGEYAAELARFVQDVIAVEPQETAVRDARLLHKKVKNITFHNSLIEDFKTTKKFDLIISLTVFEHMPNRNKSFKKMFELLKPGGFIYLTAPNKYWLFEQHYGLPFLSWLPLPLANKYLQLTKNVASYEDCSYSLGFVGMKKFFNKFPCIYEFILPFDPDGAYFGCASEDHMRAFVRKFGINLIKLNPVFWNLSKGFIIMIRKI
jgi:2-polyprenyl-3-methyl-5-hydroxy-6-metoxy-1,4-benzoquinol methylase